MGMLRSWAICLLALAALPRAAAADEAAAWRALRMGGHVALMRHTDAPGFADPPDFKVDDCATQRNLSDRGRADARAVGQRLRAEKVAFGSVLSSPWCRCSETARLLNLGPVKLAPTFGNVVVLRDQVEVLTQGARAVIGSWEGPTNLLVVTHGANIQALTGGYNPASGEIVVVAGSSGGSVREVGRIPVPRS
jgi:phosphohistidine phosphatase SixA